MQRFVPYLLALLLIAGVAPAQDDPVPTARKENVAKTETKPADETNKNEDEKDSTEVVVTGERSRNRDPFREHRRHRPENVQVRGDVVVGKGETSGDIVVVAGTLNVEGDVDGNIVAVASKAFINGTVRGSVVVVPGPVTFGPNADIKDEAVIVGEVTRDPAAKFSRGFHPVSIPEMVPIITGAKDFLFEGILMMRPLPPSVRWVWILHGAMLLVLIGMTLLFPKPVQIGAKAIAERPVVSIFSGFLTAILFVPMLVLLIVTVVGIVAVPFAIAGIILAGLFGKAAVLEFVGQQVGRNLRVAFFESPLIALLTGAVILALFYMVPVLGMLIWCVATLLGLGAIMVATASALNNQPTIPTPTGVPAMATSVATNIPTSTIPPIPSMPMAEPIPVTTSASTDPVLLRRVGFWKRTFAAFLDWVLLGIPLIIATSSGIPFLALFPIVLLVYFVGMWTWKGTSIGKICLGLKIVKTDGTPIDFAVALVRSLAAFFSFIVFLMGFFWAGWDKEKQSWHDKIAGTVVVQVPKGVSLL